MDAQCVQVPLALPDSWTSILVQFIYRVSIHLHTEEGGEMAHVHVKGKQESQEPYLCLGFPPGVSKLVQGLPLLGFSSTFGLLLQNELWEVEENAD